MTEIEFLIFILFTISDFAVIIYEVAFFTGFCEPASLSAIQARLKQVEIFCMAEEVSVGLIQKYIGFLNLTQNGIAFKVIFKILVE